MVYDVYGKALEPIMKKVFAKIKAIQVGALPYLSEMTPVFKLSSFIAENRHRKIQ